MSRHSPFPIDLTVQERRILEERASHYTLPYRDVLRARMVLLAAAGATNEEIAEHLGTRREVVSKWRKRFFERRIAGLRELPRSGRPRRAPKVAPSQSALIRAAQLADVPHITP